MNFREKVKAIVEANKYLPLHGGVGRPDLPDEKRAKELDAYLKAQAEKKDSWVSDDMRAVQDIGKKVKARKALPKNKARARVKAKNLKKSKPKNESSDHVFYQKVKALSRGKKSQSILEKKSNTIRLLIAKIKPCGEKSNTDDK